jgi:type IV secretion system protein VirB2
MIYGQNQLLTVCRQMFSSPDFKQGMVFGILMSSFLVITPLAQAALPWEQPLTLIANSLSGPTAKLVGGIAIIGTGCALAFGEHGSVMKRMLMIVCGLSIAFFASTLINDLFPSRDTTIDPNS